MRPAERSPTLCWEKLRGRLHPRAPLKSLHRPLPLSLSLSLSWFLTATAALLRAEIPLDGRSLNQAPFHLQTPRPADSLALRQPFACLLIFHVMLVVLMIRRDVSILDQGRLWPSRCAKGSRGGEGISLGTTYLGPRLFSRGLLIFVGGFSTRAKPSRPLIRRLAAYASPEGGANKGQEPVLRSPFPPKAGALSLPRAH
jgi:hypothetical protein